MTLRLRGGVSNLLFMLVLVVYAAVSIRSAAASPLTYDQIYTVYLSQFHTPGQLWDWLSAGTDLNPPLNYLLTHLAFRSFGVSPLTARLPAMTAYGGAVLLTFVYLRLRHRSEAAGWFGGLALLACNLPFYAVIARAYALMVFWGTASLLLWYLAHTAVSAGRRASAAIGLGGVVAAGVYTHYYCVFVLVPISMAEITRLVTTGRFNKEVVLAVVAGTASAVGLLPLIQTARDFSSGFWRRPSWGDIELCYGNILLNAAIPLFVAAAAAYLVRRPDPPREAEPADRVANAAVVGFLVIPVAGLILAKLSTGAFDKRYVIMGYLGAVGVFGGLAARALKASRVATGIVVVALLGWWLLGAELRYRKRADEMRQFEQTVMVVREFAAGGPVVVIAPDLFLSIAYAEPNLRGRLVYPADRRRAMELIRSDTDDRNLIQLARAAPGLAVRAFDDCPLQIGAVVVGDWWQRIAWGKMGYRFEPAGASGSKVAAIRVTARPK